MQKQTAPVIPVDALEPSEMDQDADKPDMICLGCGARVKHRDEITCGH